MITLQWKSQNGSFKVEAIHGEHFSTRTIAKKHIFEYIEIYYNRVRLYSSLGYTTPELFEDKKQLRKVSELAGQGQSAYYGMTQYPAPLQKIESHVRRRFRARVITQQKLRRNLYKCLTKRNIKRKTAARTAISNNGNWAMSNSYAMQRAFNLDQFKSAGLKTRSDTQQKHWFNVNRWVYLP